MAMKNSSTVHKPMTLVSIIIVNYYKANRLKDVMRSLSKQSIAQHIEVVIVDNSCSTSEELKIKSIVTTCSLQIDISDRNLGYTKGCNRGVRLAQSDFLILMNPDIVFEDNYGVEKILACMADEENVIVYVEQINDDGTKPEIRRKYPTPWSLLKRRLHSHQKQHTELLAEETDWIQSSFMALSRKNWDRLGGFDETYFLFMADIDLCRRANYIGLKFFQIKDIVVRADGKRASKGTIFSILNSKVFRIHVTDAVTYFYLCSYSKLMNLIFPRYK